MNRFVYALICAAIVLAIGSLLGSVLAMTQHTMEAAIIGLRVAIFGAGCSAVAATLALLWSRS